MKRKRRGENQTAKETSEYCKSEKGRQGENEIIRFAKRNRNENRKSYIQFPLELFFFYLVRELFCG